jgi:hypothetical protein
LAVEIAGTEISANRDVLVDVGIPDPVELKNTRNVVATEVTVADDATGLKRTRCIKLPLAPEVNAKNWSVPIAFVAPPSERTNAAVVVIFPEPTFGVKV